MRRVQPPLPKRLGKGENDDFFHSIRKEGSSYTRRRRSERDLWRVFRLPSVAAAELYLWCRSRHPRVFNIPHFLYALSFQGSPSSNLEPMGMLWGVDKHTFERRAIEAIRHISRCLPKVRFSFFLSLCCGTGTLFTYQHFGQMGEVEY